MARAALLGKPDCIWPLAAELGEGPIWWRDRLWFTDIKTRHLHACDGDGQTRQTWQAPGPISFLAPRPNGHFVVGAQAGLYDFDPGNGRFAFLRAVEPGKPGNRLNDGAVDPVGRLWFGSMDDAEQRPSGNLYRLDANGVTAVDKGYVVTNGPTFSPDGRILYHTDTQKKQIYAFTLAEDGTLGDRRVFVTIEDGAGWPDGPVVDAEGCLWTGLYGGWAVRRYSPQGVLIGEVRFPVANVTKIAFGGADLKTAYATTARKGIDDPAFQPLAGGLFRFAAPAPGLAQPVLAVSP